MSSEAAVAAFTCETWLPVPGFEGLYEISDQGRVYAHPYSFTVRGKQYTVPGRMMKQRAGNPYGHRVVSIGGKARYVHRLVLEAFAGPCPPGMEALHGPGGRTDNRWPENLRWGTHAENAADMVRDGTRRCGTQISRAKLTEAAVLECRRRHAAGEAVAALAAEYGVGRWTMAQALTGRTWAHVPEAVTSPAFFGHAQR